MQMMTKKMKPTPTKISLSKFNKIQKVKFNSKKAREIFIAAVLDLFSDEIKAKKVKITKAQTNKAKTNKQNFVAFLKFIAGKIDIKSGSDREYWYDDGYLTECATNCGTDELRNLPTNKEDLVKALLFCFIENNLLNDPLYFKYYDNILDEGKKTVILLHELGWVCTGYYKNQNMKSYNIEMSMDYGA